MNCASKVASISKTRKGRKRISLTPVPLFLFPHLLLTADVLLNEGQPCSALTNSSAGSQEHHVGPHFLLPHPKLKCTERKTEELEGSAS